MGRVKDRKARHLSRGKRGLLFEALEPRRLLDAAGHGLFEREVSPVSSYDVSPVAADLNRDGAMDFVTVGGTTGDYYAAVLLGRGDGTFEPQTTWAVGRFPSDLAVGDVNGDGIPDLVVSNKGLVGEGIEDTVSVLIGNGDGTFRTQVKYTTGGRPDRVSIADMNKDGLADLVTVNREGPVGMPRNVSILFGLGGGAFGSRQDYALSVFPEQLVVADLNNDGWKDVAACGNQDSQSLVVVRMGGAGGVLGSESSYSASYAAQELGVGDLNGDGKLDLITSSWNPSGGTGFTGLSVFVGRGDGTFNARTDFATDWQLSALTMADVNGDGRPDALAVYYQGNVISVSLGTAGGSFGPATEYMPGPECSQIAVADFNGDGKADIALSDRYAVSIIPGNGDGTFQSPPAYGRGTVLATGDLNGDHLADLVTTVPDGRGIRVRFGLGDGRFGAPTAYATGGELVSAAIADFNRDGAADIVAASSGQTYLLINQGNGTFVAQAPYSGGSYVPIQVGDFNSDTRPDVMLIGDDVLVRFGQANGTLGAPVNVLPETYNETLGSVAVADFTGDGIQDIAAVGALGYRVFPGRAAGTFGQPIRTAFLGDWVTKGWSRAAAGDVNGDGKQDLVVEVETGSQHDTDLFVVLGNGNGTFTVPQRYEDQVESFVLRDVNGDGRTDVITGKGPVFLGRADGTLVKSLSSWQPSFVDLGPQNLADLNNDGRPDFVGNVDLAVVSLLGDGRGGFGWPIGSGPRYPVGPDPKDVAVADLNGDGHLDVITANQGRSPEAHKDAGFFTVTVRLGEGNGRFGPAVNYFVNGSPRAVTVADLNGDGAPEIVTANEDFHTVSVLRNLGDGTFAPYQAYDVMGRPIDVAVADVNNDGRPDLLAVTDRDLGCDLLSVRLGIGGGFFGEERVYRIGSGPTGLDVGDFNRDGKLDVVTAAQQDNAVTVLFGDGQGSFAAPTALGVGGSPNSVAVGDLNGDGAPDIVAGAPASVLINTGNGTFLPYVAYGIRLTDNAMRLADINGDGVRDIVAGTVLGPAILLGKGDGSFRPQVVFAAPSPVVYHEWEALAIGDVNEDGRPDLVTVPAVYDDSFRVFLQRPGVLGSGPGATGVSGSPAAIPSPIPLTVTDDQHPLQNQTRIDVTGTIRSNANWSGLVVVEGPTAIAAGVTVTIAPGTIVKFKPHPTQWGTFELGKLNVYGTLNAQGTVALPIVFTSFADDTAGGDTNQDGSLTRPATDDWDGINFVNGTVNSVIRHVEIRYADVGIGGWLSSPSTAPVISDTLITSADSGLSLHAPYVNISRLTVLNTRGVAVSFETDLEPSTPSVLSDITVSGAGWGGIAIASRGEVRLGNAHISGVVNGYPLNFSGASNLVYLTGLQIDGASCGLGKTVYASGGIVRNVTLTPDFVWVVDGWVEQGTTLTILPGTVVKTSGLIVRGALNARGTVERPITITAIYDDTVGGDTGQDGWGDDPRSFGHSMSVKLVGAGASGSVLENVVIRCGGKYVGGTAEAALRIDNASPTISDVTIQNSYYAALEVLNGAAPSIRNVTLDHVMAAEGRYGGYGFYAQANAGDFTLQGATFNRVENWPVYLANASHWVRLSGLAINAGTCDRGAAGFVNGGTMTGDGSPQGDMVWQIGAITIAGGTHVTMGPGTILKGESLTVNGTLDVVGSSAKPVIFTSIRDDTAGGDTNLDGNASVPASGSGLRLRVNASGHATVERGQFRYGPDAAVQIEGGQAHLIRTEIRSAAGRAVVVNGGQLEVNGCTILQPSTAGVYITGQSQVEVANTLIVLASGADGVQGLGSDPAKPAGIGLVNNTIVGGAHGVGLDGGFNLVRVINNVIAFNSTVGIGLYHGATAGSDVRCNDLYNPGATQGNYANMHNYTGENGNISVDPKFRDRAGGDYRLAAMSPCIDAAYGNAAPIVDRIGAPRFDDWGVPNSGQGQPNYADMGSDERIEDSTSPVDLIVVEGSIVGPISASFGQTVTVQWTVRNVGTAPAVGPWHDRIYLATGSDALEPGTLAGEVLVGQGVTLQPGQTLACTAPINVPAVVLGSHYWQIQTNYRLEVPEGVNRTNNLRTDGDAVRVTLPELTLGHTVQETFEQGGDAHYWFIRVAGNQQVLLTLDDLNDLGGNEVYVGLNGIPTRSEYQYRFQDRAGADQRMQFSSPFPAIAYIMVYGRTVPDAPGQFRLTAEAPGFKVERMTPDSGGDVGNVTALIEGQGFGANDWVCLVRPDGEEVWATQVYPVDGSRMYATFNLVGQPLGFYDVLVQKPDGTETLKEDFFQVRTGKGPVLEANLIVPENIRRGDFFPITITWANTGDVDMVAPIINLIGPDGITYTRWGENDQVSDVQFVASSSTGPAGVLQPGDREEITIYGLASLWSSGYAYTLQTIVFNREDPYEVKMDPGVLRGCFSSDILDMTGAEMEPVWEVFEASLGETQDEVIENLASRVTAMNAGPDEWPLVRDLLLDLLCDAEAKGGGLLDSTLPYVVTRRAVVGADHSLRGIDLIFSEDMDPSTIGTNDVVLTNPLGQVITPVAVVARSGQVFRISFAAQSTPGVYTLAFGPHAADTAGLALDQNRSGVGGQAESDVYQTVVEVSAPPAPLQARAAGPGGDGEVRTSWPRDLYVVNISETGKRERQPGLPMFVVTFSKPVNMDTFGAQDIAIGRRNTKYDPVQILTGVTVGGLTPLNADCTQFQVSLREPDGPLSCVDIPGFYTVRIGTDIMAKDGTLFDQDRNAVNGQTCYEPLDIFEIIDTQGPTVTGFELPEGWGRVTRPPVSQVDIIFNEPIQNFPASAVTVEYDNNGTWEVLPLIGAPQPINDSGGPYPKSGQRNQWRVTFAPKDEEGTYRVTVGPGVTDYYGRCPVPLGLWDRTRNEMDQDQDGKNGETNGDDTWHALFEAVRPSGEVYGRIQYTGDWATLFNYNMHISVQLWEMDGDTIDLGTDRIPGETDDFISDWNLYTNGAKMRPEDLVRELYRRGVVTADGRFRFERAADGEAIDFVDLDDGNDQGLPPEQQHIPEFYIVVVAKNEYGFVLENGTLQDTPPDTAICMPLYPDRVPEGKDQQWGRLVFLVSPIMRPSSVTDDELDFGTIPIDENQTAFGLAQWLYQGGNWLHDALGQTAEQRPRGREAVIYSTPTVNHVDFVEGADYIQADEGATDPFEILRQYGHAIDFWAKGYSPADINNVYGILIPSTNSQTAWYEAWATYFAARVLEQRVDLWPFMSAESRNRSSQGQWEYNNFWMAWDAYSDRLQRDAWLDLATLQGQFVYNGATNYVANHGDVVMGACLSIYWDLGDVVVVGETGDDYVNGGIAAIIAGLAEDWYPGVPLTNAMKAVYIDHGIITTQNGQSVGDDDMESDYTLDRAEDRSGYLQGFLTEPLVWKNKMMVEDQPGYGDRNWWIVLGKAFASSGQKKDISVRLKFDPAFGDLDMAVDAFHMQEGHVFQQAAVWWGGGSIGYVVSLEAAKNYTLSVDVAGHGALTQPRGETVTYMGDMHPSYSLSINPTPDPIPLKDVTIHSRVIVPVVTSWDPNEKSGPAGVGANHYVTPGNFMPYTIYFENDPELATAPARTVRIVDQLDADLDWNTFEWGVIQFGERTITIPDPTMLHFETDTTVSYDTYPVHVVADFNPQTGRVTWELQSRDPQTGEPPRNPMAGFLPPNDDTGHGEGFVTYSVRARSNLRTGTQIRNVAEITFDAGPTFTTNQVDPHDPTQGTDPGKECLNTIDAGRPSSQVAALPATMGTSSFLVTWSGQDDAGGSGIVGYDIYVSTDNGPFVLWKDNTAQTQATFTGQNGHTYAFYSTAQDAVGHVEQAPATPDAQTQVRIQARVVSWQVAGGLTQRSDVRALQIGFSDDVQVDAGDMTLINLGVNADVDADAFVAIEPGMLHFDPSTHVLTVSFGRSLADGWYEFRLNPAGITGPGGLQLSSDGTGPYRFHRLLGDLSADQVVNVQDVARLRQSMGTVYNANSDVNGDGRIDGADVEAITGHLGATVVAPLRMRGDLTGDGAVNVLDVARLRRANAGIPGSDGDVNGDGRVNAADADQLMRALGVCVAPSAGASGKPIHIAAGQVAGATGRTVLSSGSYSLIRNVTSNAHLPGIQAQVRGTQEWMGFEDIIRRMNEPHVGSWSMRDSSELVLDGTADFGGDPEAGLSDSTITESAYSDGGRGGEDLMSPVSRSGGEPLSLKAWRDALLPSRYEEVLVGLEG